MKKDKLEHQEEPETKTSSRAGTEGEERKRTAGEGRDRTARPEPENAGTAPGEEERRAAESGTDLLLEQQEKISELEKRVEELSESNLRKTAELDNMRKRMQRDRLQLIESSKASALEHFLPVFDDLQRTLEALDENADTGADKLSGIGDGIRMVAEKFRSVLERYDVERIDETGVPFDVDLHDALMRRKPEDMNTGSDVILQVLESGYRMGDRTIRHAKVIVSE